MLHFIISLIEFSESLAAHAAAAAVDREFVVLNGFCCDQVSKSDATSKLSKKPLTQLFFAHPRTVFTIRVERYLPCPEKTFASSAKSMLAVVQRGRGVKRLIFPLSGR